jgi:hypothetical protein
MGRGIDMARPFAPLHAAVIDDLKDQLLIVFLKRLGGKVEIPVAEIDDTGSDVFSLRVEQGVFYFETRKKSVSASAS